MEGRPTPLIPLRTLPGVYVKDEGAQPFGSWRHRDANGPSLAEELAHQLNGPFRVVAPEGLPLPGIEVIPPAEIALDDAVRIALDLLPSEGFLLSTFGAAGVAAAHALRFDDGVPLVIVNPSSALLQIELFRPVADAAKLGGLVTPR